jgi:hypothetical protein
MDLTLFNQYARVIAAGDYSDRDERLRIAQEGSLSVYYAPLEGINAAARVVLVGLTPGPTQMMNALREATRQLRAGATPMVAIAAAKARAAFSGEPMRSNLFRQLDNWGVHRWLGLATSAELFATHRHLMQTTSLLCYPVFQDGRPYVGSPAILTTPLLKRHLERYFLSRLAQLQDAQFIPLGTPVATVFRNLVEGGAVPAERVLSGVLHPSGNNTYRINWLTGPRSSQPPAKTDPRAYDAGKLAFRQRLVREA